MIHKAIASDSLLQHVRWCEYLFLWYIVGTTRRTIPNNELWKCPREPTDTARESSLRFLSVRTIRHDADESWMWLLSVPTWRERVHGFATGDQAGAVALSIPSCHLWLLFVCFCDRHEADTFLSLMLATQSTHIWLQITRVLYNVLQLS